MLDRIKPHLTKQPMAMNELVELFENFDENKIIKVIRWLRSNGKIHMNTENKFEWKK